MSEFDRREFLRRSALTGAGIGLLPQLAAAVVPEGPPRVRRLVTLGRTGLRIPDIGFGASRLTRDEALVRHAFDRGITHFDTAEGLIELFTHHIALRLLRLAIGVDP